MRIPVHVLGYGQKCVCILWFIRYAECYKIHVFWEVWHKNEYVDKDQLYETLGYFILPLCVFVNKVTGS